MLEAVCVFEQELVYHLTVAFIREDARRAQHLARVTNVVTFEERIDALTQLEQHQ
ncbi:hypothetical protein [Burkholderia ubonensis]|uniref:hypothetical protein n=1 Tax=Burkholderia ubonensis TaxID=101571 RepID=UPI0012F86C17|nr:hypothetical protein [Burkholderia ubonensis]